MSEPTDPDDRYLPAGDDGIIEAELVDSPAGVPVGAAHPQRPTTSATGWRLWIPAWFCATAAVAGMLLIVRLLRTNGDTSAALWPTGSFLTAGLIFSFAAFIWPQRVNGRRRWIAASLGLMGNSCLCLVFLILLLTAATKDQVIARVKAARRAEQRARYELLEEERRHAEAMRATRIKEAARLRRLADYKAKLGENNLSPEELAERRRRVHDFTTNAARQYAPEEVIYYAGDPSQAAARPLPQKLRQQWDNGELTYLDLQVESLVYAPQPGRMVGMTREQRLIAIDTATGAIVRQLVLPSPATRLIVTRDCLVLVAAGRMVTTDWDLRPVSSAPLLPYRLGLPQGHPALDWIVSLQERGSSATVAGLKTEILTRPTNERQLFDASNLEFVVTHHERDESDWVVSLYENDRSPPQGELMLVSSTKAYRRLLPIAPTSPSASAVPVPLPTIEQRPGMTGKLAPFGRQTLAVCYRSGQSDQAEILVYDTRNPAEPLLRYTETPIPGEPPRLLVASAGERIYVRQGPRRLLTWIPGTDRVEAFQLPALAKEADESAPDIGHIQALVPSEQGVWVQMSSGIWGAITHPPFAASPAQGVIHLVAPGESD